MWESPAKTSHMLFPQSPSRTAFESESQTWCPSSFQCLSLYFLKPWPQADDPVRKLTWIHCFTYLFMFPHCPADVLFWITLWVVVGSLVSNLQQLPAGFLCYDLDIVEELGQLFFRTSLILGLSDLLSGLGWAESHRRSCQEAHNVLTWLSGVCQVSPRSSYSFPFMINKYLVNILFLMHLIHFR